MGQDVDEWLAYDTPKVVRIRDRSLGALKYIFMFVIFCYVFVFQLAYKGAHFQLDQLSGLARVQLQHPVKSKCNPMDVGCSANYSSLQELPYCKQYVANNTSPVDDILMHRVQRDCKYFDALDLLKPIDSGYLVPSFIETYDQVPSCKPSAENNFACDNKYEFVDDEGNVQKGSGRAKPKGSYFVADVEDFTLLIDHSFKVETGAVEYDDHKMQGYWMDCSALHQNHNILGKLTDIKEDLKDLKSTLLSDGPECVKRPITCVHDECEKLGMVMPPKESAKPKVVSKLQTRSKGSSNGSHVLLQTRSVVGVKKERHRLESDLMEAGDEEALARFSGPDGVLRTPEVFSISSGDVLSIRTLYAMAGRSLDDWWYDSSANVNRTVRQRGTVLVVNIHYNNLKPWTLFRTQDPAEYEISVTARPVDKYKSFKVTEGSNDIREMTVAYGTLIIVQSSGSIGVFRMIHMLIVVSTSAGLMAAASVLTDVLALYVMPMSEEYNKAKYQETADIHDMYAQQEADAAQAS